MRPLPMIVVPMTLSLFACAGGSSGGGPGASQTEAQFCEAREKRAAACAPDGSAVAPSSASRASCGKTYRCTVAIAADPNAILACKINPDCNASTGDGCLSKAGAGRAGAEADACAKKYAECKAAGGKKFDDDTCSVLGALKPDVLAKVSACVGKPCDQIGDCIEATVAAISVDCD